MVQYSKINFKKLTKPYLFVLKEGQALQENPFDYTLLLLNSRDEEVVRSPAQLARHVERPQLQSPVGDNPTSPERLPQEHAPQDHEYPCTDRASD